MSKYLETLPQYHFDRDDFCKVFREVFTDDEIIDIDVMCGYPQNTDNFLLYRWEDEFYIIHRDSGTIINWYKHLGRTNTCNKEAFTLADLKELLLLLKEDLKEVEVFRTLRPGSFCTAQTTDTVLLTSVPAIRKCSLTALSQKPHTTFGLRGSAVKITESLR